MKKLFCIMFGLALLPLVAAVPLFAQPVISSVYEGGSSNPLTTYVAGDLSEQVLYKPSTDSYWQFNPNTSPWADGGFFATYSGNIYGPDFASHPGGTSVPDTQFPTPWAFVSQQGTPDGQGYEDDPWTLSTIVNSVDGNLNVKQKVSYVQGDKEVDFTWIINNNSGGPLNCVFTHAAAMYMQGDGTCSGCYDSTTGAVVAYNQTGDWYEQIMPSPILSASAYELNEYGTIWNHIIGDAPGTGIGLQNYINPNNALQAFGIQWNFPSLPAGQTVLNDKLKFGPIPPICPTSTPTPPPPPPPVPGVSITLNSTTLTAGDQFTVDVTVQPVNQRFDAWAVIVGGGKKYSMVLNKPGRIRGGLYAYITRVNKLTRAYSGHLLNIKIPPGVTGSYNVIVGLVPSGKKPSVRNVIPGYLAQTSVTVQ
jgi:hypothetical protein